MKLNARIRWALFSALLIPALALGDGPSDAVSDYISAFKLRNKGKMLGALDELFYADFKKQYLIRAESYPPEKLSAMLRILGLETLDQLKAMGGRDILAAFLDRPEADGYWAGFDKVQIQVDAHTEFIHETTALVKSTMSVPTNVSRVVETNFVVTKYADGWKISKLTKKVVEMPNKSLEPTPTAVTPPAGAGDRAGRERGSP